MPGMTPPRPHPLELKIPPPVVALACALLAWRLSVAPQRGASAWRLSVALPAWTLPWPGRHWLAGGLVAIGLALDLSALSAFLRARTTINPLAPARTSSIVRGGAYRFTRNPMYLGLACSLSGLAAWLAHPLALAGPVLFVAWVTRFQIVPEERALRAAFGAPYADYLRRVRRGL